MASFSTPRESLSVRYETLASQIRGHLDAVRWMSLCLKTWEATTDEETPEMSEVKFAAACNFATGVASWDYDVTAQTID